MRTKHFKTYGFQTLLCGAFGAKVYTGPNGSYLMTRPRDKTVELVEPRTKSHETIQRMVSYPYLNQTDKPKALEAFEKLARPLIALLVAFSASAAEPSCKHLPPETIYKAARLYRTIQDLELTDTNKIGDDFVDSLKTALKLSVGPSCMQKLEAEYGPYNRK
jgi:hypothetical protein